MPTIQCVFMGEYDREYGYAYWGDGEPVFEAHDEEGLRAMQGMLAHTQEVLQGESPKAALLRIPEFYHGVVWASARDMDAEPSEG